MIWMRVVVSAMALSLVAGCGGDDDATDTDAGAHDAAVAGDGGEGLDAGTSGGVTFEVVHPMADGPAALEGATVWVRLPDGTLLEETSPADGVVTFEEVDLDAGGLEVTVWKEGYFATSQMGFGREAIAFFEAREWPASAEEGRMQLSITPRFDVTLSGTVENDTYVRLMAQPLDGFGTQHVGFPVRPWTVYVWSQPSVTLMAWDWTLPMRGANDRSNTWEARAAFVEVAADSDTTDVLIDFAEDVPLTEATVTFTVPTGTAFFDDATPIVAGMAKNPLGGMAALSAFPLATEYDEATSTLTGTVGVPTLPAGEWGFLMFQLAGTSRQSNVYVDWDGSTVTETLEPEFLSPPTLTPATAGGIDFGDAVGWSTAEEDVVHVVQYSVDPPTDGAWNIQYWGAARSAAVPPELPADVVGRILPTDATVRAGVQLCGYWAGNCVRIAASGFDVTR